MNWRATDLEALRQALAIAVSPAAIRAINDAMAQLERFYPDAIAAATRSLDAIASIDLQLAALTAADLSVTKKLTRKGAAAGVLSPQPQAVSMTPGPVASGSMTPGSMTPGSMTPGSMTLPIKKLDVIEYDTDLLLEELSTEYATGAPTAAVVLRSQRLGHVNQLLLIFPGLANWLAPRPSAFAGQLLRG
ncbi:MAG: hypothetical protein ACOYLI_13220 [Synechococcus lacustris]